MNAVKRRVAARRSNWLPDALWSVALALVLVLTGCTLSPGNAPASPEAASGGAAVSSAAVSGSAAPPASDAEALAAAGTVYTGYLAAMDAVSADGGAQPERITPFVTDQLDLSLAVAFESMRAKKIRVAGSTQIAALQLVSDRADAKQTTVTLAACLDISSTRVLDAAGADITPANRADHRNYRVILTGGGDGTDHLVVAEARPAAPAATCS